MSLGLAQQAATSPPPSSLVCGRWDVAHAGQWCRSRISLVSESAACAATIAADPRCQPDIMQIDRAGKSCRCVPRGSTCNPKPGASDVLRYIPCVNASTLARPPPPPPPPPPPLPANCTQSDVQQRIQRDLGILWAVHSEGNVVHMDAQGAVRFSARRSGSCRPLSEGGCEIHLWARLTSPYGSNSTVLVGSDTDVGRTAEETIFRFFPPTPGTYTLEVEQRFVRGDAGGVDGKLAAFTARRSDLLRQQCGRCQFGLNQGVAIALHSTWRASGCLHIQGSPMSVTILDPEANVSLVASSGHRSNIVAIDEAEDEAEQAVQEHLAEQQVEHGRPDRASSDIHHRPRRACTFDDLSLQPGYWVVNRTRIPHYLRNSPYARHAGGQFYEQRGCRWELSSEALGECLPRLHHIVLIGDSLIRALAEALPILGVPKPMLVSWTKQPREEINAWLANATLLHEAARQQVAADAAQAQTAMHAAGHNDTQPDAAKLSVVIDDFALVLNEAMASNASHFERSLSQLRAHRSSSRLQPSDPVIGIFYQAHYLNEWRQRRLVEPHLAALSRRAAAVFRDELNYRVFDASRPTYPRAEAADTSDGVHYSRGIVAHIAYMLLSAVCHEAKARAQRPRQGRAGR